MKEYLNYHDIVLYYHKCNIFDNIENIIAILDALDIMRFFKNLNHASRGIGSDFFLGFKPTRTVVCGAVRTAQCGPHPHS